MNGSPQVRIGSTTQFVATGLYELNSDGTPQTGSNGNMIPTYTQDQVQAFARAYWTDF